MEKFLTRLLAYFNIDENEYLTLTKAVNENNFAMNHQFEKMDEACKLCKDIMNNHKKIFIYGDYDADGIMGVSILVKMFSYLKYDVSYYVPNRYIDGYGITLNKAKQCVEDGYELVITVDNGISAFEPISYLHEHNVKVIVLDHHQMQEKLPNMDVVLHPIVSNFGNIASSGAFVAFMFASEMLGYFDKYLSTLASISLVSDMMPLKEYNRNLLRLCISRYVDGSFLAIDLLKENEIFNESTIGLKIAPKINAVGRIIDSEEINNLVKFFTSENKNEILYYNEWINNINEERKLLSKTAVNNPKFENYDSEAIVEVLDEKEGIIGLIANFLVNKFHKPTIIFTKDKDNQYLKGSCRSPIGFNVTEAFLKLNKYMITSGGHASAGGCSIKIEDFDDFKKDFIDLVKNTPIEIDEKAPMEIMINEINFDNYRILQSFSPFGEEWKSPNFILRGIKVASLIYSKNNEHILTQISNGVRLVGFNISKESLKNYRFVDMCGNLKTSVYKGFTSLEYCIFDVKEHC